MKSRRFPWCATIAAALLLVIAALLYRFVVKGNTAAGGPADQRIAIVLSTTDRALILTEMRQFLSAVRTIDTALATHDLALVAKTAHGVGRSAARGVPLELMAKLPLGFKRLGFATHDGFDQIAMDARDLGDGQHTLRQMGELMNNCVACHAAYQLRSPAPGR